MRLRDFGTYWVMTKTEQGFHEKYLKGITLKLIISVLLSTVSIVASGTYFGTKAIDNLTQSIKDASRDDKQFTKDQVSQLRSEMNAKFDTVKINLLQVNYQNKLELQNYRLHNKTVLATEHRNPNGSISFVPVH